MTQDHDIERALDRWFSDGPTRMPDRLFDTMVERIERMPQGRFVRLRARLFGLRPDRRLVAAIGVVVLVTGLGAAILARVPAVNVGPPPTPPPTAPASPLSDVIPARLQATWVSIGTRVIPYHNSTYVASATQIVIGPVSVTMQGAADDLVSSLAFVGPGRIELRSLAGPTNMGWKCNLDDPGTYTVGLSSDGAVMTLTTLSDTCPGRAAALAGDWKHTDLGAIAPGRHVANLFRPFGGDTSGRLAYTVPTGWVAQVESGTLFFISGHDQSAPPLVTVWSSVVPYVDPSCGGSPVDGASTPTSIAAWLKVRPGLVVTKPTPVTIGGLTGVQVDLSVAPEWDGICSLGQSGAQAPVRATDIYTLHIVGSDDNLSLAGQTAERYILLDRGDGQVLLINVEVPDKATWDAVMAAAMPIIESFEFAR